MCGLDPLGSSVPNILNKDIKMRITASLSTAGLLCEGQGFPAPAFRLLKCYFLMLIQKYMC